MQNVEVSLEIYISGQVDTLNKTFKLSYTSKVFCCGCQTSMYLLLSVALKII